MNRYLRILAAAVALALPATAQAESFDDVIRADLRPGWRLANGDHMAALHLRLAPGWKTYWRAPGDAGIPPLFSWRGSRNLNGVAVLWPTPSVFWQSGMRSVGYENELVLPIRVDPKQDGADTRLRVVVDIGICKDVCLPHRIKAEAVLPAGATRPDPAIAAALADRPFSRAEAGVWQVACHVSPIEGGMALRAEIAMPAGTGREQTVIEASDPQIWISEPKTYWSGTTLISESRLLHIDGGGFALDRSGLRITVLDGRMPVELQGCDR
jgi:DsbC/DsbD-like thiol-disulfide interchange protein